MQQKIQQKLTESFQPEHIEVVNESNKHHVPPGSESHFKVTIVSAKFKSLLGVKRHQLIYAALKEEMKLIHALSLHTYTVEEWQIKKKSPDSPLCRGGDKG